MILATPSVEPDIGGIESMKVSYADLEYLYEQKRLQTLKQRSQELAEEIDQVTTTLKALERLRSSAASDTGARAKSAQHRSIAKASGQPWGNYLLLFVLLLLLVIASVSL
jgi:hypothetical protein